MTSDIPILYHLSNNQVSIYPIPTSASNTISIKYQKKSTRFANEDYTTGTIVSIANGAKAVVGNGTTWLTNAKVGQYIFFNSGNEGYLRGYEIAAIPTDTTITLSRNYQGTSFAAGSVTYKIGDVPLIPDDYQDIIWIRLVADYYAKTENRESKSIWMEEYLELLDALNRFGQQESIENILDTNDVGIPDPNISSTITF
jgi:hypothetical protein